jgi:protein-tyrosine phosphatase
MTGALYDFHSHILPGMDDGYQDPQSALQALKVSYAQGVRYVVATPHYYAEEPVDSFLQRRAEAMQRLQDAMKQDGGAFPAA